MKYIRPFYFDEFKCSGGKCKDNCCGGWKIIIDKESCDYYKQVEGEFGKKLNKAMVYDDTVSFALDNNGFCPLLNSEQLCEVYINLGADKMCKSCKIYPRFHRKIHDVFESDLILSCPEVARILISYKEPLDFYFDENADEFEIGIDTNKTNLFNALLDGRGISVDIMQMDGIPLWKRLYMCISIADKIQQQIVKNETDKVKEIIGSFQREEYIMAFANSLNDLEGNISLKLAHYYSIISIVLKFNITNQKFMDFLIETTEFINSNTGNDFEEKFSELDNDFEKYIKGNRAFENYIVYYLFHYYMEAYNCGDIHKYIVVMVESYSLLKLFALVRWYNNGFQLSEEELIDVFYSYSRFLEHGKNTMSEVFNHIKENEFDNIAYLIALIR